MEQIIQGIGGYGYLVLFIALIGEGMGLPLPGEPTLMIAGALAVSSRMDPLATFMVSFAALLLGDSAVFYLGRWVGRKNRERAIALYSKWLRCTLVSESCHAKARKRFTHFRPHSLLWIRFVPGARILAPPLAGMTGLPYHRFILYSGMGTILWAACFFALGYALPARIHLIADFLDRTRVGLTSVVIIGFVFILTFRIYRGRRHGRLDAGKMKASTAAPADCDQQSASAGADSK